eukprot:TRINITY_DN866_c0_g2_i1.p1 TRINITY_DN866_c0_g2~~TRINITY_DN866_c0_g2_i1.p1  ORF type:complete len:631 (+),score=113.81 TRINITY_DN866_c0_g2_i1:118-2010(+)
MNPFQTYRARMKVLDISLLPQFERKVEELRKFINNTYDGLVDIAEFESQFVDLIDCIFGKRSSGGFSLSGGMLAEASQCANHDAVVAFQGMLHPQGRLFEILRRSYDPQMKKLQYPFVSYVSKPKTTTSASSHTQRCFASHFNRIETTRCLSMLEYYFAAFFDFANTHDVLGPQGQQVKPAQRQAFMHMIPQHLLPFKPSEPSAPRWQVYLQLFQLYCQHFLSVPELDQPQSNGNQHNQTLPPLQSNPQNSAVINDTVPPFLMEMLNLFCYALFDYVICMNETDQIQRVWEDLSWDDVQIFPSSRAFIVRCMVERLIMYCSLPGYRRRAILIDRIRIPLFAYLRTAFLLCKQDENALCQVVDTWLVYITPWAPYPQVQRGYDNDWRNYVVTNNPYYSLALLDFMNTVTRIELFTNLHWHLLVDVAQTFTRALWADVFSKDVYNDPNLTAVRRDLHSSTVQVDSRVEYYSVNSGSLFSHPEVMRMCQRFVDSVKRHISYLKAKENAPELMGEVFVNDLISLLNLSLGNVDISHLMPLRQGVKRKLSCQDISSYEDLEVVMASNRDKVFSGEIRIQPNENLIMQLRSKHPDLQAKRVALSGQGNSTFQAILQNSQAIFWASLAILISSKLLQ